MAMTLYKAWLIIGQFAVCFYIGRRIGWVVEVAQRRVKRLKPTDAELRAAAEAEWKLRPVKREHDSEPCYICGERRDSHNNSNVFDACKWFCVRTSDLESCQICQQAAAKG